MFLINSTKPAAEYTLIGRDEADVWQGTFSSYTYGALYYLGYGRNAWHSTWINRYYPNCVSHCLHHLGRQAETRRVQGSVFRISTVPVLYLEGEIETFVVVEINELNVYERRFLASALDSGGLVGVLNQVNRLVALRMPALHTRPEDCEPIALKSSSWGVGYSLWWEQVGVPRSMSTAEETWDVILERLTR